jgi:hypothetical protein
LELPGFHDLAVGILELKNINAAKEIGEVNDGFLIRDGEFIHFFAQEIEQLDRVVLAVIFGKIERDIRGGRVGVKTHPALFGLGEIGDPALAFHLSDRATAYEDSKVEKPHSYRING